MPQIDNIDFRQILDLVEKTVCLIGQTSLSVNYQRRLAALIKVTNDPKKSRALLKDKNSVLSKNYDFLFGKEFKEELKEYSKTRKEASDMAAALGATTNNKTKHTNKEGNGHRNQGIVFYPKKRVDDRTPFQKGPPSFTRKVESSTKPERVWGQK